ncbi:UvrD-helicase domain-containing protein [Epilithonimonas arachidiradicis]|uniref:DNA 3'-5' helicase n=1 Tax=Epilithonimonas arachidiradicis TaxID=1617282 RepID=A0A420DC74_9FLAO|nr:UvrD-helicase domain-containing protein [Epilithonimonas arachidiradicis]RKE88847.1 ATP-dependent exoDNAse (exonuclease V) beta subunit [Epilithonimonas arachidiradicis]GGG54638.1 ATP-dependent helicase [Epilithonimonas arachidiradicis]
MQNTYSVINASAGSGKTYTLVQRLLMICLRFPNQSDAIRTIIALTFTNKAANEMKERILFYLGEFVKENYSENQDLINIQKALAEQGYRITLDDLRHRSQKVLDYILHHYSTLNIGTIDKFNSRLVKSFSYELGLAQNFNLEIQPEPYLIEAVDKMLDEIGEEQTVSEAFMDFVNYNLDNNERVNLNQTLYNSAKKFVNDIHYQPLQDNKDFEWQAYENKKNELRKKISDNRIQSSQLATQALELIKTRGIDIEDFAQGKNGLGGFFQKVQDFYNKKRDGFPFPSNEDSTLTTYFKGAAAKSKHKQSDIEEILPQLISWRKDIINLYIDSQKKEKILEAILPLKVNADIQKKLLEIEEENDLVLLSKFNIIINENLRNEPSAFIYEKVGTQFQHYFFDEFQDTSAMQWQNFLPLRDNSITSDNTSFTIVGDPKQSIYRFRGGESELMLNIINQKEITPKFATAEHLRFNWRSAKNIVDFNNRLYDFMSQALNNEHQKIFGENAVQEAQSNLEGRVKVHLLENSVKSVFYEESAEKMRNDIQECLDNGFSFSDITILCRGNNDIFNYSQLLGNLKVQYNGKETHIKTISEKGLTLDLSFTIKALIEYLKWEITPKNRQFLVKMMYFLNVSGRITMTDFTSEIKTILNLESKSEIENYIDSHYHIKLIQNDVPQLNLYNFIEYYIQEFSVENKETDFLLNFLEMLFNYTQNAGATLKEFLKFWDDEASKISIQASENIDAVQIMTIHKAKGLEFPVVFIPMRNENSDKKFSEWYNLNSEDELKTVILTQFSSELETYDEGLAQFNFENSYRNKIDRFCIQYVATTRPVEQLFLYLEKPSKSSNHLELFDFVTEFQSTENGEKLDSFDIFPVSDLAKQKRKAKKEYISENINSISQKTEKASNIEIATTSKNYQNRVEHVRMGIFTHEILSKIKTRKDVPKVLNAYLLEGIITNEEQKSILERIENVLNDVNYSVYFEENLKIINEREMFATENEQSKTYRPDRLIETENGVIIVDFKTGEEKAKDQKQVETYKNKLEQFGKKVVKMDVIYI